MRKPTDNELERAKARMIAGAAGEPLDNQTVDDDGANARPHRGKSIAESEEQT